MKRIHIVGCGPRTGTTLMAEAMIACFGIDCYGGHEQRIFTRPPAEAGIFLTKAPRDVLVVRPLLWVNPDLYVVYMVRDPRDTIASKHGRGPDRYWASLAYWNAYTPYGHRLRNHPRFITVRYEDLVATPDTVQNQLMVRMPFLARIAPFSHYHEVARPSKDSLDALRGVRPIAPDGIGCWRNHLRRVAGQLKRHGSITRDLIEYGYEKDDSWLKELEGVEPDMRESKVSEYLNRRGVRRLRRGTYKEVIKTLVRRAGLDPFAVRAKLPL